MCLPYNLFPSLNPWLINGVVYALMNYMSQPLIHLTPKSTSSLMLTFLLVCLVYGQVLANDRSLYQSALDNYDLLLKKTVNSNGVDYNYLKLNSHALDRYLYALGAVKVSHFQKNERIALYVNAYNAFTLRLILDYWPYIKSIKNIPDYPLPRRFKDRRWKLSGNLVSLNDIEEQYIKPIGMPLAYLALVCATKSCPDLKAGVYKASSINKQLIDSTKQYLSQQKALRWGMEKPLLRKERPVLYVSELFRWKKDAIEFSGYTVVSFIEEFAPINAKRFIAKHKNELSLVYLDYDWQLNASTR